MHLAVPAHLPIAQHVEAIGAALRAHQVVVVAGETGSGKTTQLPKIALAAGRGDRRMIGHTQPRRIAARSLAARIAEECGVELGAEVGFAVRFTDRTAPGTLVKVMTDGILLAELQRDRDLRRYDTIIIDEAHERSLNIDFLLGYLKRLLPRRADLRLIVTSATIDVQRFSEHFDGAPIIEVSGRTYPVEVRYRPTEDVAADDVDAVCEAVLECLTSGDGDVLVFLSGQREIHDVADALRPLLDATTTVLPLYARLSAAEQHRVFAPGGGRRVILATNVAETSITVPGIRFVVDPGTARISRYSKRLKVQRLPIEPISQASANQRAGRCGRVRDGIAIRLYSEQDFLDRPRFTDPEILRTNLASVILGMAALRLGDVARFPFLDPPDTRQIRDGIALLVELGALEPAAEGGRPRLTPLGRRLARLPLDPRLGRMVLAAAEEGCVHEVVVVTAGLTIQDPRERPEAERGRADSAHARYVDRRSDFATLLNLWDHVRDLRASTSANGLRRACREQYLNYLRIREWQDLVGQVREVLTGLDIAWSSGRDDMDGIHRALLTGLLSQVGLWDPLRRDYLGARGARFVIFPGSALARTSPEWVMSSELVETSRLFARRAAAIRPEWIEAAAGHLVARTYSEPHWSAKRGATVAAERVTLFGIPLVVGRSVDYGRIDEGLSRELFIRGALVEGEWRTRHRFWHANAAALAAAQDLEERSRRRGLVIDDDGLFAFYDARIPSDVTSVRHFDAWWKKASRKTPDLLTLTPDDIRVAGLDLPGDADFPLRWSAGPDVTLDLSYAFAPGADSDGVTVDVPLPVLHTLDPAQVPGSAPGHRDELMLALLRSLPKPMRRQLGPATNLVAPTLAAPESREQSLLAGLAAAVTRLTGVRVDAGDWDLTRVPTHLLPRYRVLTESGAVLGEGRDLAALQLAHAPDRAGMLARAADDLAVRGARSWTFGQIPQRVERVVSGVAVTGFPALVDQGDCVDLVVVPGAEEQALIHPRGVRRLVALTVPNPGPRGFDSLDARARLALGRYPHGGAKALLADCADACIDALLAGSPIWDQESFDSATSTITVLLPSRFAVALGQLVAGLDSAWSADRALADAASPALAESLADARAELDRILGPAPASRIGAHRLPDLRRYLQALAWRAERMPDDPAGDARRLMAARAAERRMAARIEAWPVDDPMGASEVARRARQLIDEYRVSLFAQHIRTAMPVSPQRIERFLDSV
ncbi:MAG: ATP-dependent RNA helicase HrpA [Candidatus Nanopelagicales bacterium]